MNFKEFNEYKKSILSGIIVNPDGTTSNDNYKCFSLSYIGGNIQKEVIIAESVAEAVYKSCIGIIISKLPNISSVEADNESKFNEYLSKLVNLHYFDIVKEESKLIISENITDDNKLLYELSYDKKDENPIDSLIDIEIEDNIVKSWISYDSCTTLCIIASSPYSITQYKIDDCKPSIENFKMLSQYIRLIVSSIILHIGFASLNEKNSGEELFGRKLSYKRAILDKISMDIKNYNYININNKKMAKNISSVISKTDRTIRTLKKRSIQIKESIKTNYNNL